MSIHDSQHADLVNFEDDPSPGWQVISFLDPAGTGSDLAFTEGLSAFGLPELLLWARPTEGFDPGADWLLTHRERSRLLNRWAVELMAGQLTIGAEREERFDGGNTVARFRFGPPTLVSVLNHPYLPPGGRVISMAWSLLRQAPLARPPSGPTPTVARRMERWITEAEAVTFSRGLRSGRLDHTVAALPPNPEASPSDRFGPMTPWVNARISQVLGVDAEAVAAFIGRTRLARCGRCEDCFLDDLLRLATRSHRAAQCREASRVAQELSLAVTGAPRQPTALWHRVVTSENRPIISTDEPIFVDDHPVFPDDEPIFAGGPEIVLAADDESAEESMRTLLSDGLELMLISAVLADVCSSAQIASATGPWEWALNDQRLPGRLWLARPAFRQTARRLLSSATPDQLAETAEKSLQSAALGLNRSIPRLVGGLQTTSAASAQPGALLRRDQRRGLPRPLVETADELAGQLLTALARPHDFPSGYWNILRHNLFPMVTGLPFDLPSEIS